MTKKVLIVDDDNLVRKTLVDILSDKAIDVSQAHNGQEALELTAKQQFDLIVTDVHMPVMDGMELVHKFRKTDNGKRTPVIIMTADGSGVTLNKALLEGVSVYMSKSGQDAEAFAEQIMLALGL